MAWNGVNITRPPAFVTHSSPVITCCLISWCTDKGRGRFHGEGTLAVFVLLSTWHSVHFTAIILSHSTHSATETQGKDLSANCFQMEIKNNHTATLSKWLLLCSIWYGEIDVGFCLMSHLQSLPLYFQIKMGWRPYIAMLLLKDNIINVCIKFHPPNPSNSWEVSPKN